MKKNLHLLGFLFEKLSSLKSNILCQEFSRQKMTSLNDDQWNKWCLNVFDVVLLFQFTLLANDKLKMTCFVKHFDKKMFVVLFLDWQDPKCWSEYRNISESPWLAARYNNIIDNGRGGEVVFCPFSRVYLPSWKYWLTDWLLSHSTNKNINKTSAEKK